MLTLLRNLIGGAPIAITLGSIIVSVIVAGGGAFKIAQWKFDTFDAPRIRHEQQAADAATFRKAADDAKRAQELKVFRYIEQATNHYLQQQAEDEAWQQAQLFQLNQEIKDYEQDAGDRTACRLTQRDLDFLAGVRP